jgi:Dolichyl-phosphate-mannose-protein mannosyltransferase
MKGPQRSMETPTNAQSIGGRGDEGVNRTLAWRFALIFGGLALVLLIFVLRAGTPWRDALKTAGGDKASTEAFMHWGLWWAAAVNAGLCLVLALTARWWSKGKFQIPNVHSQITRRDWLWVLAFLTLAAGIRWGRMDLSLYNDEAHTFRRYIAGWMKESTKEGGAKWRQVKWEETFFLNQVGNNSAPCSVLGRVCYDSWKWTTRAKDGVMCETAIRFPQFVAGLASLVVLWLLLRRLAPGPACWWGLAFGVLHPWSVRYATEARGYGLLLLGVTAMFYFLQRATEDGRWRWWLGFGAAQFLSVWAFPGVIYFLAVFNGALFVILAWRGYWTGDWQPLVAAVVSALMGGMLALQLMLPTAPQLFAAMKILNSVKGAMGWTWVLDVLGGLLNGMRWADGDPANPWNLSVGRELSKHAWLKGPVLMGIVAWACGSMRLARKGVVGLLAAVAGPLAVALSWGLMVREQKFLHYWYVLYALPGALCGLGVFFAEEVRSWPRGTRLCMNLLLTLWMCFWAWGDGRYFLRSKENLKELVPLARGAAFPDYLKNTGAPLFGAVYSDVDVYDPYVRIIRDVKDLDALIAEAAAASKALYVTFGREGLMQLYEPELLGRLRTEKDFTPVLTSHGLEEQQFSHFLFRYNPSHELGPSPAKDER